MTSLKFLFPFFTHNPDVVYLDSASTSHRPQRVIDGVTEYISNQHSSVDGLYESSLMTVNMIEGVRKKVADYLNVTTKSVVFTPGVTSGLNQLAYGLSEYVRSGTVVVSGMEHHSNLLPWQRLVTSNQLELLVWPLNEDYGLSLEFLESHDWSKVKLVVLNHVSNVTGAVVDLTTISVELKKKNHSMIIIVDGSQALGHMVVDLSKASVDAFVFSAHKLYGPTGVGVSVLSSSLQKVLVPFSLGGKIVNDASWEEFSLVDAPKVFESGTPNMDGICGLGEAVEFLTSQKEYLDTSKLVQQLTKELQTLPQVKLVTSTASTSIVSFNVEGLDDQDLNHYFSQKGICVRVGSHCAKPLLRDLGLESVIRVSFGVYNDSTDVAKFVDCLRSAIEFFFRNSPCK
jgi:selenocysteine lyase/cysteine desulfurase